MNKITRLFAVCTLGLGAACGTGGSSEAKDFNPVRDTLEKNGLLEAVRKSDDVHRMCQAAAPLMARFEKMEMQDSPGLMETFNQPYSGYLCNAAKAHGYETLFFNKAILNPPAGQTAAQVKADLKEKALEQANKSCDDLKFPSGKVFKSKPGEFVPGMCKAYGHP
ncbi:MAG: hypothetical protein ACXW4B_11045 [Micavibrio sp.]